MARYNYVMPNPKKLRPFCMNNCGNRVKKGAFVYCSFSCQHAFRRSSTLAIWKAGELPPRNNINSVVRNYLIRKHGEQCQRCGWNERNVRTGRVPLEVEHIDGNWQNNNEDNLEVLCPNCHSLTPTFRALNRGNGRPDRSGLVGKRRTLPPPPTVESIRKLVVENSQPTFWDPFT